jgi:hypothetical protein
MFTVGMHRNNNQITGKGIVIMSSGDKFEGYFENGVMKKGHASTKMYKGYQINSIKHGLGTFYYLDHRVKYQGEFINDSREGRGFCIYLPSGCDWQLFEGHWENNTWGEGTLQYAY